MPLGQTITVINKSGKVVSTGKQLASVFKEAKAAYQSRKAEIKATRDGEIKALKQTASHSDEHLHKRSESHRGGVHRAKSTASRRLHGHPSHGDADFKPKPLARGFTDTALATDVVYAHPSYPPGFELPDRTLTRRNTSPGRPNSAGSFDENLAYGPLPPPLPIRPSKDEAELRNKFWHIKNILEEANCVQHSATATIEHLQKNPEALAAVALTLAEASSMVTKVAPAALAGLKTSFPAVVALLASPQFLIAAGLGLGVTVVMLGGYKVIKHVQQSKRKPEEEEMEPLQYIDGEVKLPAIESWRRGIADAEAESVGTTVDGEFITPGASRQLIEAGLIRPDQVHPTSERRKSKSEKHAHSHRRGSKAESIASERSGRSHSHHHKSKSRKAEDDVASKVSSKASSKASSKTGGRRKKAVSGLKLLFQGRAAPVS